MQLRLRSLYHYTMCKFTNKPTANTVSACSEPFGSSSGIGRLAAQPPLREVQSDIVFRRTGSVASYSLGACWTNLEKGFEEREPSVAGVHRSLRSAALRSASRLILLTSPSKLAPAFAFAVLGHVETAGAPFVRMLCVLERLGAPGRQLPG